MAASWPQRSCFIEWRKNNGNTLPPWRGNILDCRWKNTSCLQYKGVPWDSGRHWFVVQREHVSRRGRCVATRLSWESGVGTWDGAGFRCWTWRGRQCGFGGRKWRRRPISNKWSRAHCGFWFATSSLQPMSLKCALQDTSGMLQDHTVPLPNCGSFSWEKMKMINLSPSQSGPDWNLTTARFTGLILVSLGQCGHQRRWIQTHKSGPWAQTVGS